MPPTTERPRHTAVAGIGSLGAVLVLGLVGYPFSYGPLENPVLAACFVFAALFQTVLGDAFTGEWYQVTYHPTPSFVWKPVSACDVDSSLCPVDSTAISTSVTPPGRVGYLVCV